MQDIEYVIVSEDKQPEVVQKLLRENQGEKIKMSYTDQGVTYIIRGYGEQETSGYSVEVLEVYETENAMYVDTNLLGPSSNEEIVDVITCPYIVISIEETAKPIVYD